MSCARSSRSGGSRIWPRLLGARPAPGRGRDRPRRPGGCASYASQGQQRSALLALLFAERDALLAERSEPPLMLLDDVTSELDPERRELLCERLVARRRAGARDRDRERRTCRRLRAARAGGARRRGDPRRRRRDRGGVSPAQGRQGPAALACSGARGGPDARSRRRRSLPRCRRRGPTRPARSSRRRAIRCRSGDGVVTVACRSATWAQELDLMSPILLEKLREALGRGRSRKASRA